jgi:hypothetical protein
MQYGGRMSLRCFFGAHRPMLASIIRREQGFSALCDDCALPLERTDEGRWTPAVPLATRASSPA